MSINPAIQEAIVAALCYDPIHAPIVAQTVPSDVFDPYYRDLAKAAIEYTSKYGKVPGEHTLDLINALKHDRPDKASFFTRIFESIESIREGLNTKYVLDTAGKFVRRQRLVRALSQAVELAARGEEGILGAENVLMDALKVRDEGLTPGIVFQEAAKSLSFLDHADEDRFICGIPELDRLGAGPARERLHVFAALPGRGKSWWLVHLAKHALIHRKRVVYVTLELSEKEVMGRCVQSFLSVSRAKAKVEVASFEKDSLGRVTGLETELLKRHALLHHADHKSILKSLKRFTRFPRFIIKGFPTSTLTVRGLVNYLDFLESSERFIPDLLLVDYADNMKIPTKDYRLEIGQLYRELRRIAGERNIGVATASQLGRGASGAKRATEAHISEDFSKLMTADTVIIFNQTDAERSRGLARLFLSKHRTEEDKVMVAVTQAYKLGQFCLDSGKMTDKWWDVIKSDEEVEDDDD